MATNKNQHFVPRCYLRPFTLDSANVAINLFNIDRMKFVERAPVKHQCSRDYFYGEDPALEKALQAEEGLYVSVGVVPVAQSMRVSVTSAGDCANAGRPTRTLAHTPTTNRDRALTMVSSQGASERCD